MRQRQHLGGYRDGYWFTESLVVDEDGFDVGRIGI